MSQDRHEIRLTRTHRVLIGAIVAGAAVIAAIGFAGSYHAVRDLALRKGFGRFAVVFPLGVDAGIAVLLALDLLLTWLRIPLPLLRQLAWLLTVATIAFNAAVSWPDPLGVGMHAVMPVLFVATVEAARHAVGRLTAITADRHMEGVRLIRWLLAPLPTWLLWRRMRLWELRRYDDVIKAEQDRLVARAMLRWRFGRNWRRTAPPQSVLPIRLARLGLPITRGRAVVRDFLEALTGEEGAAVAASSPAAWTGAESDGAGGQGAAAGVQADSAAGNPAGARPRVSPPRKRKAAAPALPSVRGPLSRTPAGSTVPDAPGGVVTETAVASSTPAAGQAAVGPAVGTEPPSRPATSRPPAAVSGPEGAPEPSGAERARSREPGNEAVAASGRPVEQETSGPGGEGGSAGSGRVQPHDGELSGTQAADRSSAQPPAIADGNDAEHIRAVRAAASDSEAVRYAVTVLKTTDKPTLIAWLRQMGREVNRGTVHRIAEQQQQTPSGEQ
ncbi:DUF2637 domain-containing protein [Kitasatospora sp. NPDC088783]|uniref:DUF2637 domain-containing protein n=1 Tax=Kitasatospora sp. NPDC088783 TaxID=3364077 RepID=UPI003824E743